MDFLDKVMPTVPLITGACSLAAFGFALFVWLLSLQRERSLRQLLEGKGLDPDVLVPILKTVDSGQRLEALKSFMKNENSARDLLAIVAHKVDLHRLQESTSRKILGLAIVVGMILLLITIVVGGIEYFGPLSTTQVPGSK